MNNPQTITWPTIFPPMCIPGGQAQAQFPTIPVLQCIGSITSIPIVCSNGAQAQAQAPNTWVTMVGCPTATPPLCLPANAGGQAQAQFPTIPVLQCVSAITSIPYICNSGAQAQAQAQGPVGPTGYYGCSAPTQLMGCTTVTSTPTGAGNQAQAQFPTIPVLQCIGAITSIPYICNSGAQAQAQTMWHTQPGTCNVSVPPHCPTVAPMCPPPADANAGGQAQAQFPTIPVLQCVSAITSIPYICNSGAQAQAQAQGPVGPTATSAAWLPPSSWAVPP